MSSRDYILERAKANKPDAMALPKIDLNVFDDSRNILDEFVLKVETAGGHVITSASKEKMIGQLKDLFPDANVFFSTLKDAESLNTVDFQTIKSPHELEDLDVLVLESHLGVAENGAFWLHDSQLPMRVLPFIAKHLVVVLKKDDLVPFMHQAYQKLSNAETGFGVFISGPSKTADIEQSLVIGAHGALSLTVFLM